MILPGNLLKYWQEEKVIDGCRRHDTHIRCKIWHRQRARGEDEQQCRDLDLNCNHASSLRHQFHDPWRISHCRAGSCVTELEKPQQMINLLLWFLILLCLLEYLFTFTDPSNNRLHLILAKTRPCPARATHSTSSQLPILLPSQLPLALGNPLLSWACSVFFFLSRIPWKERHPTVSNTFLPDIQIPNH